MWVNLFNQNKAGQGFVFLVGNKIDLDEREVSVQQGKEKAAKYGVPYMEISAKTGKNIQDLFYRLIETNTQKSANNYVLEGVREEGNNKQIE